jgi:hypothetical protein
MTEMEPLPEYFDDYEPPDEAPGEIPTAANDAELRKLESNMPVKTDEQKYRERVYDFQGMIDKSKSTSEADIDQAAKAILSNGLAIPSRYGLDGIRFYPGTVNTLSGGSGHGKSTLALNLISEWISNPRENNLINSFFVYISYENTPVLIRHKLRDIGRRLENAGAELEATWSEMADNVFICSDVPLEDYEALINAARTVKAKELYKQGDSSIDLKDIPIVLVIDYLQIIWVNDRKIDRLTGYERMKEISRTLEQIARSENIVLLCLCQQNQEGQIRESRDIYFFSSVSLNLHNHLEIPEKSGSGNNLEIWRQHVGETCHNKSICSLICSKNRYGRKVSREKRYCFDGYIFSDMDYERTRDEEQRKKGVNMIDELYGGFENGKV